MSRTYRRAISFDEKGHLRVKTTRDNPYNCSGRNCSCRQNSKTGNSKDRLPMSVLRRGQEDAD